jgi:uncharacterized protein
MQWLNKPKVWSFEKNILKMFVTPKTDFWRKTHYGFTVDDGPFFYEMISGEFEVKVKITGDYKVRFDQMGLMVRIDEQNWIKTGIEFVEEKINLSAVVTIDKSDWSVIELPTNSDFVWIKVIKKLDAVEISYSTDNSKFNMMRLAYFPENKQMMVGMTAASPDGEGFNALFEEFEIKHIPDTRRLKWLETNNF